MASSGSAIALTCWSPGSTGHRTRVHASVGRVHLDGPAQPGKKSLNRKGAPYFFFASLTPSLISSMSGKGPDLKKCAQPPLCALPPKQPVRAPCSYAPNGPAADRATMPACFHHGARVLAPRPSSPPAPFICAGTWTRSSQVRTRRGSLALLRKLARASKIFTRGTCAAPAPYACPCAPFVLRAPAVKLNGNRNITGVLRGYDQFMNIVLDETVEHVSATENNEVGMVVSVLARAPSGRALRPSWQARPPPPSPAQPCRRFPPNTGACCSADGARQQRRDARGLGKYLGGRGQRPEAAHRAARSWVARPVRGHNLWAL